MVIQVTDMKKNVNSEGGVKAMRKRGLLTGLAIMGSLLLYVSISSAKIPEPDNIIYGPLSSNGQPVTAGEVTLRVENSSVTLAKFSIGSSPNAGSSFILRVPMDSADPRTPASARQGDVVGVYLNNQLAATVTLGPRGTVIKIPLETCSPLVDYFPDADNDGYPGGPAVSSCSPPAGHKTRQQMVSDQQDCNDHDPLVHASRAFFFDADGDGYGNPREMVSACYPPAGYVANGLDCNDSNQKEYPGQTWYKDSDADGYSDMSINRTSCLRPSGYKLASELQSMAKDCNDRDASIYPGAVEICDHKDQDCDGIVDNGCSIGDFGKMSRNSHYLKERNWLIRSYSTTNREAGTYAVYLEVIDPDGTLPAAATVGLDANPVLVAANATTAGVTLVFDEEASEAYVVYTTIAGQVLSKIHVRSLP
ncbi:MAG: hypothetical protein C0402_09070 [Thermodesulfovibrio sp.]|nr:hypothetical protein [Thermodesulfovibrio sp.]